MESTEANKIEFYTQNLQVANCARLGVLAGTGESNQLNLSSVRAIAIGTNNFVRTNVVGVRDSPREGPRCGGKKIQAYPSDQLDV